jgi:hypothetical protein
MTLFAVIGRKILILNPKSFTHLHRGGAFTLWVYHTSKLLGSLRAREDSSVRAENPTLATFADTAVSAMSYDFASILVLWCLSLCYSASLGSDPAKQTERRIVSPASCFPAYHPLEAPQEPRPCQTVVARSKTSIGWHLGTHANSDALRVYGGLFRHHFEGTRRIAE